MMHLDPLLKMYYISNLIPSFQSSYIPTNLDIVGGQDASQIKHLQHGGGTVISDAVALKHIFCDKHLPGQPALSKSSIKGQNVRQVAWLTATAALIFLHPFSDGFHFPLLAVGPCGGKKKTTDSYRQNSILTKNQTKSYTLTTDYFCKLSD